MTWDAACRRREILGALPDGTLVWGLPVRALPAVILDWILR